jgi:hypothetical protein
MSFHLLSDVEFPDRLHKICAPECLGYLLAVGDEDQTTVGRGNGLRRLLLSILSPTPDKILLADVLDRPILLSTSAPGGYELIDFRRGVVYHALQIAIKRLHNVHYILAGDRFFALREAIPDDAVGLPVD